MAGPSPQALGHRVQASSRLSCAPGWRGYGRDPQIPERLVHGKHKIMTGTEQVLQKLNDLTEDSSEFCDYYRFTTFGDLKYLS